MDLLPVFVFLVLMIKKRIIKHKCIQDCNSGDKKFT